MTIKPKGPKASQIGTGSIPAKIEGARRPGLLKTTAVLFVAFGLYGCALTGSGSKLQPQSSTLNITTASFSAAQQQSSYQAVLTASGGTAPYLWTLNSGNLPAGLSLTNATGEIAGNATQSGTFNFAVQVQDSSSPLQSATRSYSMVVSKQGSRSTLNITTTTMPGGTVGSFYSMILGASGGTSPYKWTITSGSLPQGLSLGTSTGAVSGTPSQQGTSSFTVKLEDSNQLTAQAALSISVAGSGSGSGSNLSITTGGMPGGVVGTVYGATIAATGGSSPYSWAITSGNLPSGLSLSSSSGGVSGTPTQSGSSTFTVRVMDANQKTAQASLNIAISPAGTGKTVGGVKLDQYGGREDIPCAQTTSYFHMEKINNRWWFCDPAGNAFVAMSVGNVLTNGNPTPDCQGNNTYPIYVGKYGDTTYNWGWQTLKRMTSWGFNSVGQDSTGAVMPWQTCSHCVWPGGTQPIPVPYISEIRPGSYAAVNRNGYLTEPIKDEITGTNDNYASWRGGALLDVFDPKLNTEMQNELANGHDPSTLNIKNNNPYLLAIFTDDSDWFTGSGASPDFASSGKTTENVAWITLITAPVRTFVENPAYAGSNTFIFQDTKIYSKAEASNPSTMCSISNPCSLRDYLWQKYNGNVSNLNKSWGSNYSTFDSSGTQVAGETIATADGSQRSFSHTLAQGPVSPYSVLISVGGKAQIGDCPWFHSGCITSTNNEGTLGSPTANYLTQSSSTINYSNGAITLNFVNAPAKGTAITVNYVAKGWMAGGTGLMDEDGSHTAWVGTNPWCLQGPDPNFPTYFACNGTTEPVPNANPNLGADLDNWVSQWAAKYFKTMHDDLKAVTKIPYFGLDTVGSWGTPAYSKFLEGAAPYLDGSFVDLQSWFPTPSGTLLQSSYQYETRYAGDIPLMNFTVISAQANSSYYCKASGGLNDTPNQSVRGQDWYNTVQYLLNTPGYNGDTQFVGFDWWSWQDFQGINQGLVSLRDNAYDGHEAVSGKVACSSPEQNLSCGGEAGNYGDAIGPISQANALWYKIP